MGLLDGKRGIIYGLRNDRSAAWGCAQSLAREGAKFALTFFGEREEGDVRKLAPKLGEEAVSLIHGCDLTKPEDVDALHGAVKETFGTIDFVVHSVAYARGPGLTKGLSDRYVDISADDFSVSLLSSAHTLAAAAKAGAELMPDGGAIVTLTYIGGERVIPNYNSAGIAKAALESSVRYIAHDLGPQGIRVNAISAGPMMTLSARGIKGFVDMYKFSGKVSPLRHSTTIDEVCDVCAFLVSNLSRGVTGDILYVDSGYHILGMSSEGDGE